MSPEEDAGSLLIGAMSWEALVKIIGPQAEDNELKCIHFFSERTRGQFNQAENVYTFRTQPKWFSARTAGHF